MKMIFLCCLVATLNIKTAIADSTTSTATEVMMLGVFHFTSPGNDTVKVKHLDVMSENSQIYLSEFSKRIAAEFKPTLVLLEYSTEHDETIQQRYRQYLAGNYTLPVNEIYQLGFRIAKESEHAAIASFDDNVIQWAADRLFETMPTTAPEIQHKFDKTIENITIEMNSAHSNYTIKELLAQMNDPEMDRKNKELYILTNPVSTDGEFEGALASASWWHRNFRMYAKIQQHGKNQPRILVIGGQGHTAILKDFIAIDGSMKSIGVNDYF